MQYNEFKMTVAHLFGENKLQAIKLMREVNACSLLEAKHLVEYVIDLPRKDFEYNVDIVFQALNNAIVRNDVYLSTNLSERTEAVRRLARDYNVGGE